MSGGQGEIHVPPIDLSALERKWAGNHEQVADLCRMFYAQVQASRVDIRVQAARSDWAALLPSVHALKGAAGYIEAQQVCERAAALEHALLVADRDEIAPAVAALQGSIAECLTFMAAHVAEKYGPLDPPAMKAPR